MTNKETNEKQDKPIAYVLHMDGTPLNPCRKPAKVRKMLKQGKAKVVSRKPFVIQLLYNTTKIVNNVTISIDPGRTNIGIACNKDNGECLIKAKVETRNKEVPKLMKERKAHRGASRYGERKRRQRRAIKNNTTFKEGEVRQRLLPGYESPIELHYIKNSKARFLNRKRPEGWLTPTANQLLLTHLNIIKLLQKILPVSHCSIELNKFSFMEMENPNIRNWEYQKGVLFGKDGFKEAVNEIQDGKCIFCKNKIEHYHHIKEQSKGGSNTIGNIAGVCEKHHFLVHNDENWKAKLLTKKEGLNKKYGALSVLNQIIPFLLKELQKEFGDNLYVCTGNDTAELREKYNIPKDHHMDAYVIGLASLKEENIKVIDTNADCFIIKQFRRHNRQMIHRQTERTYKLNGKTVAKNKRKRMDQKEDSLHEWYIKQKKLYGKEEAKKIQSKLKVTKNKRNYRDTKSKILPGTVFLYEGKEYVLTGTLTNGKYFRAYGMGEKNFKASKCKIIKLNQGLVFV